MRHSWARGAWRHGVGFSCGQIGPTCPRAIDFLNLGFQIKLALLDRVGRYPKTKLTHQNPSPEAAESNAIQEVLLVEIPYVMPRATICQSKSLEHGPLHATLKSYKKLSFYLQVGVTTPTVTAKSFEIWDIQTGTTHPTNQTQLGWQRSIFEITSQFRR